MWLAKTLQGFAFGLLSASGVIRNFRDAQHSSTISTALKQALGRQGTTVCKIFLFCVGFVRPGSSEKVYLGEVICQCAFEHLLQVGSTVCGPGLLQHRVPNNILQAPTDLVFGRASCRFRG